MTFLRIVIPLYLFDLSMIFSENRYPLFRIMLWILVLTRFLPQISLRNLRKLDCYANRCPLRSKTLLFQPEIAAMYRRTDISNAALALSAMLRPHHAP
jgi:hypothetical protein